MVILYNYTLLPATVNFMETFLEASLWSLFNSSVAFLISVTSQKRGPFIADFSRENR